jgi:FlaA1/EpsC-like NDP-sugar epimerase
MATSPDATTGKTITKARETVWQRARRLFRRMVLRRIRSYGPSVLVDVITGTIVFVVAALFYNVDTPNLQSQLITILLPALAGAGVYMVSSYLFGLHRRMWRYVSIYDATALLEAIVAAIAVISTLHVFAVPPFDQLPGPVIATSTFLLFFFIGGMKVVPQAIRAVQTAPLTAHKALNVLIIGAGQAGATLASRFPPNSASGYQVVGFLDDSSDKWRQRIFDRPVLGPIDMVTEWVPKLNVDLIAVAMPSASPQRIGEIITMCQQTTASIKILPGLYEMIDRQALPLYLREVNIADLLGRAVVPLQSPEARTQLAGKTVLVTGAAGSIGSEMCRQVLLNYDTAQVIALDNNETGLFDLAASLANRPQIAKLVLRIGDITDPADMQRLFATTPPHIIFHAAAYKHVPLLEDHPDQAIHTNVLGTYRMCQLARAHNVETFVFISSDKAADPINVLGASKKLGERVVETLASHRGESRTRFCSVRFGNVIGSRGSVVPLFTQQIERGGPVTVTDPETTRYFMTISEACGLVILTSALADDGGLYLLDMGEPVRIADLAAKMIRMRGLRIGEDIRIEYTSLRPGEKLHEALAAEDEKLQPTHYQKIMRISGPDLILTPVELETAFADLAARLPNDDIPHLREAMLDYARPRVRVP